MTAVEWLIQQIDNEDMGEIPMWVYDFCYNALEMEREQRLEMLTNFQVFLNENDYITDTDWDWEHMSIKFLNSKKKDL